MTAQSGGSAASSGMAISGVFCLCRHPALACLIGGPGRPPLGSSASSPSGMAHPFLHRLSYPPTRLFQPPAAKCAAVLWKTLLRKGNGYGRLTLRSSPGPQTCWGGVGTARLHVVPGPGMRMSPKVPPQDRPELAEPRWLQRLPDPRLEDRGGPARRRSRARDHRLPSARGQ